MPGGASGRAPAQDGAVTLSRPAEVRSFTVEGTRQFCWDFAPVQGEENLPPVFMVHGFRGDHHGLLRIVEALPRHRVLVPDLPGFGAAEPLRGRHDIAAYTGFVRAALAALDLGPRTVLLGHSFGSIIAAHLAAGSPGIVNTLVLVNPICEPALEGPKAVTSKVAELYYRLAARLPEKPGMAVLRNPLIVRGMSVLMAKTKDPGLRRWIHGQHDAYFSAFTNRRVVLEAFQASISETVRDVAPRLGLPVLLIAAELDDIGSVKGQHALAARIPDAELHLLPGVGHLVHYEKPAEAAEIIEDFLARRQA